MIYPVEGHLASRGLIRQQADEDAANCVAAGSSTAMRVSDTIKTNMLVKFLHSLLPKMLRLDHLSLFDTCTRPGCSTSQAID